MANIFAFIKEMFKPAAELVDNLHTSKEEKLKLLNELASLEFGMQSKILEYETKLIEVQAAAINAESTGESWLQRNWRPIVMLSFLVLILLNSFGLFGVALTPHIWTLLELGLGGYVIGRSLEKVAAQFKEPLSDIIKRKKDK
jgi:hypothetical protein